MTEIISQPEVPPSKVVSKDLVTPADNNFTTSLEPYIIEDQSQYCWNVELDDETLFCYGLVSWPITE